MSKTKSVLGIASVIFGGFLLYGYQKYNDAVAILDNVKLNVKSISSVKLGIPLMSFNAVFTLQNKTNIDFGATLSSKITIKQVRIFTQDDVYLGYATTEIFKIDLPAMQTIELPEMLVKVDTGKTFEEFINNAGAYLNSDFSRLKYKIDVEVFGNVITLST